MKLLHIIFLMLFSPLVLSAQVVTTSPTLPIQDQPVTITFNAAQGDKGLMGYNGTDVYAHTGVITDKSTSSSDWKYVKAGWTTNIPACNLTYIAPNTYQLSITPSIRDFYGVPAGEKILKMAFVFRNSTGAKTGRDVGGNDIFVDVFEAGLNVSFSQPVGLFNLVNDSQTINIQANATSNDSICLFLDNTKITSSAGQSLSYSINATGSSRHTLVATAYKGAQSVSDTTFYLVKGTVPTQPVPAGMHDGINYPDNQSATFVLFAPYKTRVYLLGDFNNWTPDNSYLMNKDSSRFWLTVNGLTPGKEYIFQYLIDDTIRIADPYCEKISDPANDQYISSTIYPGLIAYPKGKTSEIAGVIQPGQTPYNWQVPNFTPPAKEKLVVYELLIRDFTDAKSMKAVTDTLLYLKHLGVNAIELMPFNEFEGNDSWGYNPSFYFAPDKAYGTRDDYKQFIDACHQNGIAVIQDLVLNHSYGSSPLVRMYFANGAPTAQNPWYNQTSNIQNPSLVYGYDFNHNSPYTQKLVDSVASFWMSQYKVDGFRYDFTKGFSNTPYGPTSWASDYDTMRIRILKRMANAVWQRNPNAYVIFEHLADNSEETVLANAGILLWGNMNYNYNQATMGYATDWNFSWISYKNRGWTKPNVMGYMESHDEERLMYKNLAYGNSSGTYNIKDLATALKRQELASTFFYTIPGPKMLWEFGELGYDVSINLGGRLAAKPTHWDYYGVDTRKHLHDITQALIDLKKEEPVFSTNNFTVDAANAVKHIELLDASANVEIVGNFDVSAQYYTLNFPSSGTWYNFFKGDSITLTGTSLNLTLNPGEYRLYSNKKLLGYGSVPTPVKQLFGSTDEFVYPNPFTSEIRLDKIGNYQSWNLYNIDGKVILQSSVKNQDNIHVEGIAPGLYFLNIRFTDGSTQTFKISKL